MTIKKPKPRRAKPSDPIRPGATSAEETEPKTDVDTEEEEDDFTLHGIGRPRPEPNGGRP